MIFTFCMYFYTYTYTFLLIGMCRLIATSNCTCWGNVQHGMNEKMRLSATNSRTRNWKEKNKLSMVGNNENISVSVSYNLYFTPQKQQRDCQKRYCFLCIFTNWLRKRTHKMLWVHLRFFLWTVPLAVVIEYVHSDTHHHLLLSLYLCFLAWQKMVVRKDSCHQIVLRQSPHQRSTDCALKSGQQRKARTAAVNHHQMSLPFRPSNVHWKKEKKKESGRTTTFFLVTRFESPNSFTRCVSFFSSFSSFSSGS